MNMLGGYGGQLYIERDISNQFLFIIEYIVLSNDRVKLVFDTKYQIMFDLKKIFPGWYNNGPTHHKNTFVTSNRCSGKKPISLGY